jgi:hypothetical protein
MACRQVYPVYLEVINPPRQMAEAFVGVSMRLGSASGEGFSTEEEGK